MIPGRTYTLADVVRILRRGKWLIVVPLVLISAATYALSRTLPDRFLSETLILVVPQRVPEAFVRSTVTTKIEDRLPAIQQTILSRSRLERIVLDFDLYPEERRTLTMEDVVGLMRLDISVRIVEGEAFRVTYEAGDPRTAQKVAERLAALFIEENLRDRTSLAAETRAFLESQLKESEERLLEHERKLEVFQKRHAGELPSQAAAITQAIQTLQLQLQTLTDSLAADRARLLVTERMKADVLAESAVLAPAAPAANGGGPGELAADAPPAVRLDRARKSLQALRLGKTDDHPDVRYLQQLVARLEKEVAAQPEGEAAASAEPRPVTQAEALRNNQLRQLDADSLNLKKAIEYKEGLEGRLREELRVYQSRQEAIPTRETELVSLTRDYTALQESYQALLKKKQDAQIAEAMEDRRVGEQFKVLDAANLPEKPSRPNRLLINVGGAAAGLFIGLGLLLARVVADSSLQSEADVVAALALPVLTTIPLVPDAGHLRRRRVRIAVSVAAVMVVALALAALAVAWRT